ncbi:MAG: hypothetical protein K0Q59_2734 [Paenibacillus sp.]|nr:hypothetical protein [Paenibacillus sp.]
MPDGAVRFFYTDKTAKPSAIYSRTSGDGGATWGGPVLEFRTPPVPYPEPDSDSIDTQTWYSTASLIDEAGEIHVMFQVYYGAGTIGVTRFMDVYHSRTIGGRTSWTAPAPIRSRIWCGSAKGLVRVRRGDGWRLIATFAQWRVDPVPAADECQLASHVYTSDDDGATWQEAKYADGRSLNCPAAPDFNGNNYGAIEGSIVEMSSGLLTIWLRTQQGWLYEAVSRDGGSTWSSPSPSSFRSSSSPAYAVRLADRRIVILWCNQPHLPVMRSPAGERIGIYSGRDALHAAISVDGGATWQGYRELYLDPRRNDPPAKGDVGVAYPNVTELADGTLFVTTGQGSSTAMLRFHPNWLQETGAEESFAAGELDRWSTYAVYELEDEAPGLGKKPPRTEGACLVAHSDRPGARALHVRKADPLKAADGANWSFPGGNGVSGVLRLRVRFEPGFAGAFISLNDAFYDPWHTDGEREAIFRLHVASNGTVAGGVRLELGRWHTLKLAWNLRNQLCAVTGDGGEPLAALPMLHEPANGAPISYLRLKNGAGERERDPHGFMIEAVSVDTSAESE